jgi:RNA polymerase sigma factor (sigma-70 family)
MSSHDADDVEQEAMIAATEALKNQQYDRQRGSFKVWLKGVISHKIAHARRVSAKHGRGQLSESDGSAAELAERVVDPQPDPARQVEEAFETEWQKALYDAALDEVRGEVEPKTFQAFDLCTQRGWEPKGVAAFLGMRKGAVNLAVHRVRERIKAKLASEADQPHE